MTIADVQIDLNADGYLSEGKRGNTPLYYSEGKVLKSIPLVGRKKPIDPDSSEILVHQFDDEYGIYLDKRRCIDRCFLAFLDLLDEQVLNKYVKTKVLTVPHWVAPNWGVRNLDEGEFYWLITVLHH